MSTPPDEMKRRAQAKLSAVPPSGNTPVGPATVQPRWTPPPSPIWTPPGSVAPPVQQPRLPNAAAVSDRLAAARASRPGMPTATMVRERLAAAPAAPELPPYRTSNGFQQTAAPVNPNPRPVAAGGGATPPGPTGAATRVPGATGRPLRPAGKLGAAGTAALALEGLNIAGAAQEGGVPGAVGETTAAATRLGSAKLGADLGRKLPLPGPWKAAGAALGGIAGYAGGQELVDMVSNNTPQSVKDVLETVNFWGQRSGNTLFPGAGDLMFGEEQFTPRFGPLSQPRTTATRPAGRISQGPNAAAAALLGAAGSYPSASASASAPAPNTTTKETENDQQKQIVGTFQMQGRPQRQVFEDGSVSPAAADSGGAFSVIPAYQGAPSPAAERLAGSTIAGPGFADSERRQFGEQIDAQIKSLGELNMASKRRLVADLLGLKGRNVGMGFEAATGRNAAQAQLMQQANEAQLRADVDREQIAAGERSSKRSARSQTQTITAEDGTVYSIEGSTLTPLSTASGEQIKAPRKVTPNAQAEIAAQLLEGMILPGASPEDVQAAAQQASSAAAALLSGPSGGGAQAAGAPKSGDVVAGYRFKGGDPNDQKNWTKVE